MTVTPVRIQHDGGLAELVLSAPERRNALDLDTAERLRGATAEIAALPGLRVVLLRAEGEHFCVGGDLRSFAAHGEKAGDYVENVAAAAHEALENLDRLPVPVVSAVQGAVAGAGVGLAFAADVALVARSARIRLAYTAVGLSPDNGSSWLLPRLVGPRRALELALTNRVVTADEAVAWGLASRAVADEEVQEQARAVALRLAGSPADALIATKRLFRESRDGGSLHSQLARESAAISALASTPQAQEAIQEFVNR